MTRRLTLVMLALVLSAAGNSPAAQGAAQKMPDPVTAGNGPVSESKAGQVFCGDALSHAPTNVGKALAESIVVEFKNRPRAR